MALQVQFKELQQLHDKYKERGFVVLVFPSDNFYNQEFESINETMAFCKVNYGVNFPVFAKVDITGINTNPHFKYLMSEHKGSLTEWIKSNFTKFLIDCKGRVVERIAPQTSPLKMVKSIRKMLNE